MIDCGYKCEGCKKTVSVEKDLTIFRFPKILVIHFKRFYHSAMRKEKLNSIVSFPEQLDMRSYAPHSSKPYDYYPVQLIKANRKLFIICMELHITVAASMVGTMCGKLSLLTMCSDTYNFGDKRWYNCNDSQITRLTKPDPDSSSAYVLFYCMQE